MARLFTIDSIEGNSNLGNPVFSKFGKMANYAYIALSPQKEDKFAQGNDVNQQPLNENNM